jgi:DNA end-binding protein Ku
MARAIWSGSLNFGLVTVPVELFTATRDHTTHFHQLERGTSDRVRIQRVNERTGKQVAFKDIVKGYEVDDGQYVVIEPEELDEIAPGRSKAIEISGFVDLEQVEPIFFATTYYLGPKGAEYGKVYALLREALAATNRAGVATFVMRGKQYLTAIKAEKDVLVLHTMHYADEIREPAKEIDALPVAVTVNSRELSAARQLIETLGMDWDPNEYKDEYQEKLQALVEAKLNGEGMVVGEKPPPSATNVVDLMDALERSIARGRRQPAREEPEPGPERPRGRGQDRGQDEDGAEDLSALTKAELYERATQLEIPGRSTMTRAQLAQAVSQASQPRRGRRSTVA